MSEQIALLPDHAPVPPPPELLDAEFAEFRSRYPKRPNVSWSEARKAYGKARRVSSAEQILAGIAAYQWSADPKYRPMPETWLNQRRFNCVPLDLEADPWGIGEWLERLPEAPGLSAHAYKRDVLEQIMFCTGNPETWRGDLSPLNAWLADGRAPDSIMCVIMLTGMETNLRRYDRAIRTRAMRV